MPIVVAPLSLMQWLDIVPVIHKAEQLTASFQEVKKPQWYINELLYILYLESNRFERESGIVINVCSPSHPFWEWFEVARWAESVEYLLCGFNFETEYSARQAANIYWELVLEIQCCGFRLYSA